MTFFFFLTCGFLLFFSLFVFFSKNTIYSILSLILVFIFSSILLFSLGLDYIPLIFITIYVGALSVLFIFVIMMLHVKTYGNKNKLQFLISFILCFSSFIFVDFYLNTLNINPLVTNFDIFLNIFILKNNPIATIGTFFFSFNYIYICLASFVLLIAMLGSVTLVLEPYKPLKSQKIYQQISRTFNNSYFKIK